MLSERLLQKMHIFLASVIVFIYAFEGIWGTMTKAPYVLTGGMAAVMVIYALFFGRLYRNVDIFLWVVFMSFAWISTIVNLGVSLHFFMSQFFCVWLMFLAIYCAVQITDDPREFLRWVFAVYSAALCMMCLYVLVKATESLRYKSSYNDYVRGCFRSGRLCAMNNANLFAFSCVVLIISSLLAFLSIRRRLKFAFIFTGFTGWLCLGLTGCRSGMIGVSLSFGIVMYSLLQSGKIRLGIRNALLRNIESVLISVFVFWCALESFLLPVHFYRLAITAVANLTGQSSLLENVSSLVIRRISDDDGTFSDRIFIWPRGIQQCLKTPRRFLIGISPFSKEPITGVYEGHHEILTSHSHNTYIELLRKHGALGLITWISLLFIWGGIGIRILFDKRESSAMKYLMAAAAGILVMGLVEPVPFMFSSWSYAAIPFFLAGGYCFRNRSIVK
ncbi:O-antigen ligase family protein [Butyrivibrio sp. FCS006]|uniref:O-antigen ligase family protein n=1 Tax=Butyrivibrio sp. FCS006 TaxID=1280684 RepID=UPI000422C457|nr:O-antigen ligase family protein [Butyrivibrio sp. FCS006]